MRRTTQAAPDPASSTVLVEALRSVLRFEQGLADEVVAVRATSQGDAAGAALLQAVRRHRVEQVLAPHVEALELAPTVGSALRQAARESRLAGMASVASTIAVSDVLTSAGIRHLVLKGVALAQQTTGDAVARGAGDVDLLVAPEDITETIGALERAGMRRDPHFAPAPSSPLFPATLRTQQELVVAHGGVAVDVHWRLDVARECMAWSFEELYDLREDVVLADTTLPALDRTHAAVFNAAHGTRDAWSRLRAVVDQVRLMDGLDAVAVVAEARRGGAGLRLDLGLTMAAFLLGTQARPGHRRAPATARRMWSWVLAGEEPAERVGLRASTRLLGANLLTYDSPRAMAQRSATLAWPVRDMAARSLGDWGDERPWLYPAATPYFLSKRALVKLGTREAHSS